MFSKKVCNSKVPTYDGRRYLNYSKALGMCLHATIHGKGITRLITGWPGEPGLPGRPGFPGAPSVPGNP